MDAIAFSPGIVTHHGFTVLASSTRNEHEWIVLLLRAPDYYVTAKYPRPIDTTARGWFSGHYFDNIRDAVDDFYNRA